MELWMVLAREWEKVSLRELPKEWEKVLDRMWEWGEYHKDRVCPSALVAGSESEREKDSALNLVLATVTETVKVTGSAMDRVKPE
jgi:hypothetical protein